jgi:phosphate transport system substrate-binding protein
VRRWLVWLAVLAVALAACSRVESPRPTPVTERYRLIADETALPLLRALTDAYAEVNPYVIFTLESGSPADLAERLRSGQVTLGATATLPPEQNPPWWLADLALDGIAVIVHPQNPVSELTLRDVRDLFSGVRNRWDDYGAGGIGNVEVAVREDGDGGRALFDRIIMGDQRLTLDAMVMPSAATMLNYVALRPGAIGYVPGAAVAGQNGVKALKLDGQVAAPASLASGDYPLSRTLYLIAPREPQGEIRNFIAWALGPHGKQIAASLGYATMN